MTVHTGWHEDLANMLLHALGVIFGPDMIKENSKDSPVIHVFPEKLLFLTDERNETSQQPIMSDTGCTSLASRNAIVIVRFCLIILA